MLNTICSRCNIRPSRKLTEEAKLRMGLSNLYREDFCVTCAQLKLSETLDMYEPGQGDWVPGFLKFEALGKD